MTYRRTLAVILGAVPLAVALVNCVADDPTTETTDGSDASNGDATTGSDGGTGSDSASEAATSGPINGKVLDNSGAPILNAKVRVGTGPAVTTDATGAFTFADAPASYDLDVVPPSFRELSYRGLTTRSPTIHIAGAQQTAPFTYSESNLTLGTVDGGVEKILTRFYSGLATGGVTAEGTMPTNNSSTLSWTGPTNISGNVIALIVGVDPSSGATLSVRGKPSPATVALVANTAANAAFNYVDAPQGTISGTIDPKGTVSLVTAVLHDSSLPAVGVTYAVNSSVPQTTFSIPTYDYLGATFDVGVSCTTAPNEQIQTYQNGLSANATNVTLDFGTIPAVHLTSPTNSASGVTLTTPFTWTTTPGVFEFTAGCSNGADPDIDTFELYTMGTTTTIPDLAALGAPLMSGGASCTWGVTSFPSYTSVDEILTTPRNSVTQSSASGTFFTQ
jgi:hypothetical protein